MHRPRFKSGQLVKLVIKNRSFTNDGFQTIGTKEISNLFCGLVYSKINIESYPSFNDFSGDSSLISENDLATVVSFIGRPYTIKATGEWEHYDVYEILINGAMRQVFSYNLEPSLDYFEKI